MRGSLVIARDYSGSALVMRVWDIGRRLVYLSDECQFQQLSTGLPALTPIGFPREDVFAYDPEAIKTGNGSFDWSSLRNFQSPVTATHCTKDDAFVSSK